MNDLSDRYAMLVFGLVTETYSGDEVKILQVLENEFENFEKEIRAQQHWETLTMCRKMKDLGVSF